MKIAEMRILDKKGLVLALLLLLQAMALNAQIKFRSIGTKKSIDMELGYHGKKGAYVWYKGQKEPIPLKFSSLVVDSTERASGQPDFYTYKWTEMYRGKAIGEYGFMEWPRNIADIYYLNYANGKKVKFELAPEEAYDGKDMALVHDVQFHYHVFYKDSLTIRYKDGTSQRYLLNALDEDNKWARYVYINDYNFDGIDDVAFSITSADGLHVVFDVFIYQPAVKKFKQLQLPKNANDCGFFTNLQVDKARKQLITKCKDGPLWQSYAYVFDQQGKLMRKKK